MLIANGLKFKAVDSDFTGDKYTAATWGLCHDEDKVEHRNLELTKHQTCPFDMRPETEKDAKWGCFYGCAIFTKRKITKNTKDEAMRLYDIRIIAAEKKGNGAK